MKPFTITITLSAALLMAAPMMAQEGWGNIQGRVVWGPKDLPVQMPIQAVNANNDKNHCLSKGTPKSVSWRMATAVATAVVMAA